jgi:iron complex transport system substrate-binding protein
MRIVSLCPSNTELLGYLELTGSLVAVDDYSDWPGEVRSLPRLGPDLHIRMDEVEQLQPDLVVASLTVPGMEKNIEELERRKLPYTVLNPKSLDDIGENILQLGEISNIQEKSQIIYKKYHQIIDNYRSYSQQIKTTRPSIYWEWWPKPVFTPGGANWLTEISFLAGGRNVYEEEVRNSLKTDWQDVMSRNPDIINLVWVGVRKNKVRAEIVKSRQGWEQINAVRNNQIHILDEPLYCRPSPRLLTGLKKLAFLLHPEQYPPYKEGEDPLWD